MNTQLWTKGKYAGWGRANRKLLVAAVQTVWAEENREVTLYSSVFDKTTVLSLTTSLPGRPVRRDDLVMSFIIKGYTTDENNVIELKSVYLHPGKYAGVIPHLVNAMLAVAKEEMKGFTEVRLKVKRVDQTKWKLAAKYIDAIYTSISLDKQVAYKEVFGNIQKMIPVLNHNHRLVNLGFPAFIHHLKNPQEQLSEHFPLAKDLINVFISYVLTCDDAFSHLLAKIDHFDSFMEFFKQSKDSGIGDGVLPVIELDRLDKEQATHLVFILSGIVAWAIANSEQKH